MQLPGAATVCHMIELVLAERARSGCAGKKTGGWRRPVHCAFFSVKYYTQFSCVIGGQPSLRQLTPVLHWLQVSHASE